jgi:cysteinyl-tRNA synthetase
VNRLNRQAAGPRLADHVVKCGRIRHLEHNLRLAVLKPAVQDGTAEPRQHGRHRGVRDLRGDLAAPHVQVRPDHQGQLRRHGTTVDGQRPDSVRHRQPGRRPDAAVSCGPVTPAADRIPVRLFNTLTRQVADFVPASPPDVGMYSCGPTVYADQHIGNMRAYVFADTLKRVLTWKGYLVRHVINITDVGHLTSDADEGDDKLELAARREHTIAWEIADRYTRDFKADLERLSIIEPDVWCKATDHVGQMISFAEVLDAGGWCYRLPSGLYFDTATLEEYGALARLDLAGQQPGARVEVAEGKRNAADFAIWRTTAPGENRQMEWDSPWGAGVPGWHLECSVMSIQYLGSHFDIHTGGVDHIPVHHTNEIAQSETYLADGRPWVRWWLHGEFINLRGAKISKSTGGGVLVGDLIDRGYHPLVYRYLLLQAHYRSQTEFSWAAMDSAQVGLRRLLDRFAAGRATAAGGGLQRDLPLSGAATGHLAAFDRAVCDDLNTPRALAAVAAVSRDDRLSASDLTWLADQFDRVLAIGLADLAPADLDLRRSDAALTDDAVAALVAKRSAARAARDFATSDQIRDQLAAAGVAVEDHAPGESTWRWQ